MRRKIDFLKGFETIGLLLVSSVKNSLKGGDILLIGMRTIALDFLIQSLCTDNIPDNPQLWFEEMRKNKPRVLFPYLVEDSEKIEKVYILEKESEDMVGLNVQDIVSANQEGCTANKLPFMKPSGSQSAQVGPVFKRSYNNREKIAGPSEKILATTMGYFEDVAISEKPWSSYFREIISTLNISRLRLLDGTIIDWATSGYKNMLSCAVEKIGPQSKTVFLTIKSSDGELPGEKSVYIEYLIEDKLAGERYVTNNTPAIFNQTCSLCSKKNTTIFSNGLKGAGINLTNADRVGVFPGIDIGQAWKKYGICSDCADLLSIYKNHVLKKGGVKKDRIPFGAKIAGESALVIPSFLDTIEPRIRLNVLKDVISYVNEMKTNVSEHEDDLLDVLKDKESIMNLTILWANVGQNIDNITGIITAVLPSRLRELSQLNIEAQEWIHPLLPRISLIGTDNDLSPNLSLTALRPLFYRPGGKKAKDINKSRRLFQVKQRIAECGYYKTKLNEGRFWEEFLITARWYLLEAIVKKDGYQGLLYEGKGKNGVYLTGAGWIKYFNWWSYYLKKVGVLEMEKDIFEPVMPNLKPYFGPESGIDTPDKAYAFLLGVLYGKVLQVQGARGVNVGANALTWLKRLTLRGENLPELYCKIREKSLAYEIEANSAVRDVLAEVGRLGARLGEYIRLNEVQTSYYLLLGQSMTGSILPSQKKQRSEV